MKRLGCLASCLLTLIVGNWLWFDSDKFEMVWVCSFWNALLCTCILLVLFRLLVALMVCFVDRF